MTNRATEAFGALAGLIASLSVGVPLAIDQVRTGGELVGAPPLAWWSCYVLYVLAFMLASDTLPRPAVLTERRVLAVQGLLGAATYALGPDFGWTAVLLVVTAITAAFVLPPLPTAAVVGAHAVLLLVVPLVRGHEMLETLLVTLVYTSFQAFAVLIVWGQRRETEARTRLTEANLELRAATALLAESSRATERLRIARELHDLVGHQLTALALELEVASHRAAPPAGEHVARARGIAKELLSDVRAAVGELRATSPGLRPALETVTAEVPRPRVHLTIDDDLAVDEERTVALIRCVQEIVTNAIRHADAANLWIELSRTPHGATRLEARDDGCGVTAVRPGNGLRGIRERVEDLGGSVRFDGRAGRGFCVVAQVPAGVTAPGRSSIAGGGL